MDLIQVRKSNISTTKYIGYRDKVYGVYNLNHEYKYKLLKSVIGTNALLTMSINKYRTDVDV